MAEYPFDERASRDLVDRASSGDAVAVESLLERYVPLLLGHLRRQAGGAITAKESSADLAQSVCREVLQHVQDGRFEYRGEPEFRAWLLRTATHKLQARARYWRAHRRDVRREHDPGDVGVEDVASWSITPSRDAAGQEELARFMRAFDRLTPEHREIVQLVRFEGLTHAEAAARLGIPESHSRMRLSRALSRLARLAEQ